MFLRYVFRGSRYRTREIAAGERPAASGVDRGDNSNSAHALAAYLLFENTECRVAYGGVEAVAIGIDWVPDVSILDISMPECNGLEAVFALRHDPRPVALLSSHSPRWMKSKCASNRLIKNSMAIAKRGRRQQIWMA